MEKKQAGASARVQLALIRVYVRDLMNFFFRLWPLILSAITMQNTGTCGACQQAIYGPHLKAFNMTWHLDHLLCKVCQCKFEDGRVCEGVDGYAYCTEHWTKAFCPPCGHCKEPIEGPTINALDKSYHPDHFVCAVCKQKLTGQFYPSKDGDPLCENDYYHHLGLICGGCEQPIISGKVVTMTIPNTAKEVKYHLEHFGCNFCKQQLAGTTIQSNEKIKHVYNHMNNQF
jgi:paxillin